MTQIDAIDGHSAQEPAEAALQQSAPPSHAAVLLPLFIGITATISGAAVGYFSCWLIHRNLAPSDSIAAMQWIVTGLAGVCGWLICWVSFACQTTRSNKLAVLISEIHKGLRPMEDLSTVNGPQRKLAAAVLEILHNLRSQRVSISLLEEETRQRIANRTNALERKIGSLREQSFRDALTGLHNRRALDQMLPQFMEQCRMKNAPLTLLMIDVDYFKALNDTLGHGVGDEFLRILGQIIQSTIRQSDAAFRCGGDEFVILMPNCERQPALNTIQRLQSLTLALTATYTLENPPRLSAGACMMSEVEDPTAEKIMRKADELLYAVKIAGKRDKRSVPAKA